MQPFDAQRFYGEISLAVTAFFSLNDKESLLIVGDLLGCLAEEADVLAQHADTPATARYQLAYDNLATVAKKLQINELLAMLNRLAKCDTPAHTGERKRVINEILKQLDAARALHSF
ncbi:MAG: hypothetical protein ACOX9E_03140 [Lentisphaeria bacterium]|jgi:hypothetical protein